MVLEAVACKHCGQTQQVKPHRRTGYGTTRGGTQRYRCFDCGRTAPADRPQSKRTPTKRVIRWSKPKLPNLDSTEVGYAIPPVYWASIGIQSAAILKKSSEVLPVNPKYVGRSLILSLKVDKSWSFVGSKQRQRWL